jgi:predicted O-methyltransferase YrrM
MPSDLADRVRRSLRNPRRALGALHTRAQWQRLLGWEPEGFRTIARDYLFSGKLQGWRYRQDLALLYQLAAEIPGPGVTLEIGTFKGLATTALAFGVREGGHARVHTVDPHTGDRQDLEHKGVDELSSLADFRRAMATTGLTDEVTAHVMTSDELATKWDAGSIRVLFIDGWHSEEAVRADIANFVPLLDPTGVVVIDDYLNYDDVRKAVDDARGELPPHGRRAGRMWLASMEPLPPAIDRFLKIPWG